MFIASTGICNSLEARLVVDHFQFIFDYQALLVCHSDFLGKIGEVGEKIPQVQYCMSLSNLSLSLAAQRIVPEMWDLR